MFRLVGAVLFALPVSIAIGTLLGDSTVAAMNVWRSPITSVTLEISDSDMRQGRDWAHAHRLLDAYTCPAPSLRFHMACVDKAGR